MGRSNQEWIIAGIIIFMIYDGFSFELALRYSGQLADCQREFSLGFHESAQKFLRSSADTFSNNVDIDLDKERIYRNFN